MIDDNELLRAYAEEGSQAAFSELVCRHLPLVYSAALRRLNGDTHAAADIAQMVFTALAQNSSSLLRHTALTAWLYTATKNAAVSLARSNQRRLVRESVMISGTETESSAHDWEQLRPMLDSAMDQLSTRDREAVLLHYFQGRRFSEVGVALGLSPEAARKRVERALETLRHRLTNSGVTSTAAALGFLLSNHGAAAAPVALTGQISATATAASSALSFTVSTITTTMSTLKATAIGASLLALLAISYSLWERNTAHDSQLQVTALGRDLDLAKSRLRQSEQMVDVQTRELAALKAKLPGAAPQPRTTKPAGSGKKGIPVAEYRRLLNVGTRSGIDPLFGPFFKQHGYSSEKINQIKDIMTEGTARLTDITMAARQLEAEDGQAPSKTVIRDSMAKNSAQEEQELKAVMGETDYSAWKQYAQTALLHEVTNELASLTFYSEAPLTAAQSDQLVKILSTSAPGQPPIKYPTDINWGSALEQAKTLLSPAQMEILQDIRTKREAAQQLKKALAPFQPQATNDPGRG